jgi:hypothetical protein
MIDISNQMRKEAARLLAMPNPKPEDYGRIQDLLIRRAAEISAPFFKKLARIKAGRCPSCHKPY